MFCCSSKCKRLTQTLVILQSKSMFLQSNFNEHDTNNLCSLCIIWSRDNEFIREGILTVQEKQNREYRFLLKSNELICSDVKDGTVVFTIQLNNVKFQLVRENEKIASKQKIVLFKLDPRNSNTCGDKVRTPIYQNYPQLTLSSSKLVDIRLWIKSFLQVKMVSINISTK